MNSKICEEDSILNRLCILKSETSLEVTTEILRLFSSRQMEYERQLLSYSQEGEFKKIQFLVHNLKSASANIGAVRLPEICQIIEDAEALNSLVPFYLQSIFSEYKKINYLAHQIFDQIKSSP